MTAPAATVLIDTYNQERFIEEAVESALQQDFPASETEILVVDDGSKDRTAEIVRKFEPRVRLLRKPNGGQASAFNAGIPEARGEIVAFLDGDDWWKPNKLSEVIKAFAANPQAGVVGHGIIQIDDATKEGSILTPETAGYFDMSSAGGAQAFRNYMCFLGTSRVAIRRGTLDRVLPVPETLRVEADEFMSAVAVAVQGAVLLSEPLAFYRLHDDNLYQFRVNDSARLRNKMNALDCLARELAVRLRELGIPAEAISIVVDPVRSSVGRMRLVLDGGSPWETYCLEREDLRHSYSSLGGGYRAYKHLSLAMALLMPPRYFYRLRSWYAAKGLRRWRSVLGEPKPMASIVERRAEASDK
ncbi:MAG TPA: glycosyltransferase family A protein [Verrucomicrobiae bacterium]|nr:glycosyltransferase family A protein [Verrucomicrobiae bacterium]